MTRSGIVVERWVVSLGWQYHKGFHKAAILAALECAFALENLGTPVRVYERTPDGPKIVHESPRS